VTVCASWGSALLWHSINKILLYLNARRRLNVMWGMVTWLQGYSLKYAYAFISNGCEVYVTYNSKCIWNFHFWPWGIFARTWPLLKILWHFCKQCWEVQIMLPKKCHLIDYVFCHVIWNEIHFRYVLAYLKGIQDVGVFVSAVCFNFDVFRSNRLCLSVI